MATTSRNASASGGATAMKIGFLLGGEQERKAFERAMKLLEESGIAFEVRLAEEDRPLAASTRQWIEEGAKGKLAALVVSVVSGAERVVEIAGRTTLPVVAAVLGESKARVNGLLQTLLDAPMGDPVAVVGCNQAVNAALLAARIGAVLRPGWRAKLSVKELAPAPVEERPQPAAAKPAAGVGASTASRRPTRRRVEGLTFMSKVNPDMPDPFIIEGAADTLLNGGVVALPTDTVYGLAVDAANADAVRRLYELKGRDESQAIPLLISEIRTMRHLSPAIDPNITRLMNEFWPGPLTIVTAKFPGSFQAVSRGDSIGVRMPNNNVTLGIISMLRRPLAVTSANVSGQPPATTVEAIKAVFDKRIDLIVDAGPTNGTLVSTVIDMTVRPYRILREGAISYEELRKRLGDALEKRSPPPEAGKQDSEKPAAGGK